MSNPTTKTPDAVFVPDDNYRRTIDQLYEAAVNASVNLVLSHWDMGQLLVERLEAAGNSYGKNVVQQVANDLGLRKIVIGVSTLYCCRQTFINYPNRSAVEEMSRQGLTASHLRSLASVPDKNKRQALEAAVLLPDGGVMSVRELDAQINKMRAATADSNLRRLEEGDALGNDPVNDGTKPKKTPDRGGATDGTSETPDDPPGDAAAADVGKKGPLKPEEAKDPKKQPSSEIKTYTTSPLKVTTQATKTLDKFTSVHMTELFLAAKEYNKIGYDSDTANKKAVEGFRTTLGALVSLQEALPDLIAALRDTLPKE